MAGIMFQDITTLLLDPKAFKDTIDLFVERYKGKNISVVAGKRGQKCCSFLAKMVALLDLMLFYLFGLSLIINVVSLKVVVGSMLVRKVARICSSNAVCILHKFSFWML